MSGSGSGRRIPSLDGLRAVSILMVLFAHVSGTVGFPRLQYGGMLAGFGVRVFFVISGYLITSLLLDEEARTQTISLRHFYLRRTLRIFPPFYVFVGAIALAAALGWIALRPYDLLAAVTYTTNYHHQRAWYLGHAWSLSVEEQFYLLWPFVVKALGSRRAARVALGAVIVAPLLRIVLLVAAPALRPGIGETFPTVMDTIATGCLLACRRDWLEGSPRLMAFLRSRAFWLVPILALVVASAPSAKLDCLFGETITNLGIALLIARVVRYPDAPSGRLLNARPIVFIGALSYSLYLWQQPFINRQSTLWLNHFPVNLAFAAGAALLSYYLVERPALRLRAVIERRMRPGRAATRTPAAAPPPSGPAAASPSS
jgi:peptidoglycan/LPS O-acetylase OafA/YrhL